MGFKGSSNETKSRVLKSVPKTLSNDCPKGRRVETEGDQVEGIMRDSLDSFCL